jgi:hypothetical protein
VEVVVGVGVVLVELCEKLQTGHASNCAREVLNASNELEDNDEFGVGFS